MAAIVDFQRNPIKRFGHVLRKSQSQQLKLRDVRVGFFANAAGVDSMFWLQLMMKMMTMHVYEDVIDKWRWHEWRFVLLFIQILADRQSQYQTNW